MKKRLLSLLPALLLSAGLQAQSELSNFTATGRGGVTQGFVKDYQAIGINPANLGWVKDPTISFSVMEAGAGAGSRSLTREQLRKFMLSADEKLDSMQKAEFARAFNNENAFNLNLDIMTFGFSVQLPKLGGLAVSNRQRIMSHVGLNKNAAEILFLGKNAPIYRDFDPNQDTLYVSKALSNSDIQISWVNEWNVAYGRTILSTNSFKLHAGVGYKYIEGVGVLDIRVREGQATAYTALSPYFRVDYGSLTTDPTFNLQRDKGTIFNPNAVGKGHGYDIGVSAEIGERVRVGASITEIGNMTWKGNLLTATDQPLAPLTSEGISSFQFFKEVSNLVASGEESIVRYEPGKERKVDLPTKFRAGAGFKLSEMFETGVDLTIPMNDVAGNLTTTFVGLGLDFKPVPFVRLSSGFTAGAGYSASIPLGITLVTPIYEAGIATRDITSLMSENNPYISAAFGFLRFRISTGS